MSARMKATKKTAKKAARHRSAAPARNGTVIYIGADHAGVRAKARIVRELLRQGLAFVDCGAFSQAADDDYPDIARLVARRVVAHQGVGILVCGTGTGMAIAANKVKGARAAFAFDAYAARMARADNDANILTLRGRRFPLERLPRIVKAFLETPFSGLARHRRRIAKLERP